MVPMREGTGMTPSQYKVYLWLTAHARQSGLDTYLVADDPDDFGGRGIAGACGVSPKTVKDLLRELRDMGAMEKVGTMGKAGGVARMPWRRGWRYVDVDCRELLKCFAFGVPFCAAEAYMTLMEPRRGSVPGMTEEKGEDAVRWLVGMGMADDVDVTCAGEHVRWLSAHRG